MKKTIIAMLMALFVLPSVTQAKPYTVRDYYRPYGVGTAIFKKDNLTVFLNTDIQVELYRPMGVDESTETQVNFNDVELKHTIRYDLPNGRYVMAKADVDVYKGVGTDAFRTNPQGVGDDAWVGIGNNWALLKMGRFAAPSCYFGASMAVEGPVSGIFSRGLYPVMQSDQSIGLYTTPTKGWMVNVAYMLNNELDYYKDQDYAKGDVFDMQITHYTRTGWYAQAMFQHSNAEDNPETRPVYMPAEKSWTAYGLTVFYKPGDTGVGGSYSHKQHDGEVFQATLIQDIHFGSNDGATIHVGYGARERESSDVQSINGWYANIMYVIPEASNVNVFAQVMTTNEKVDNNDTGVGFVTGMRVTL